MEPEKDPIVPPLHFIGCLILGLVIAFLAVDAARGEDYYDFSGKTQREKNLENTVYEKRHRASEDKPKYKDPNDQYWDDREKARSDYRRESQRQDSSFIRDFRRLDELFPD
jgi:hypothetical protein